MNRTDRLLALVLELQGKGIRRAEDLAARFEITKRTVYRDIQALCEAGVPVVSLPGQGYSLMDGYFLPPLSFSTDEATVLLLGSDFVAQYFDSQYRTAAKSAIRKIEAVLSTKLRAEVLNLQTSIALVAMSANDGENETLKTIRRSIIEHKTLHLEYRAYSNKERTSAHTIRDVDPYGLVNYTGLWYLIGYCHLRQDMRYFRLDRMINLTILDQSFTRPADFTMERLEEDDKRSLIIKALFDESIASEVREWRSYYLEGMEDTPAGLVVTLRVHYENEMLNWLLGWGGNIHILEPESLKKRVIREAKKIIANHAKAR